MTNTERAIAALSGGRFAPEEWATQVPRSPGLYAIHGSPETWQQLGLGEPPDDRPLYAGKAESSLHSRDVKVHFGTGATGHSTLRRSLAALLRTELDLEPCPRNVDKPGYFTSYGLMHDGDQRLTEWMRQHLSLAVWASPEGVVLDEIETDVLEQLHPPLNLSKVRTHWTPMLKAARQAMTRDAKTWKPTGQ